LKDALALFRAAQPITPLSSMRCRASVFTLHAIRRIDICRYCRYERRRRDAPLFTLSERQRPMIFSAAR
jgi:hypothetical protein